MEICIKDGREVRPPTTQRHAGWTAKGRTGVLRPNAPGRLLFFGPHGEEGVAAAAAEDFEA